MNLSQMHIYGLGPMNAGYGSFIHDRKVQLGGKKAVNAAFGGSGIYEGADSSDSRYWLKWCLACECRVKTNIYEDRRAVRNQQIGARSPAGNRIKSAFGFSHGQNETGQTQAG